MIDWFVCFLIKILSVCVCVCVAQERRGERGSVATRTHICLGCHFEPNCFNTSCQVCKILLWYQWPVRSRITRMCLKIVRIPRIQFSFSPALLLLADRPGKNSTSNLWVQSQTLWFRFIKSGREKWWTRRRDPSSFSAKQAGNFGRHSTPHPSRVTSPSSPSWDTHLSHCPQWGSSSPRLSQIS